MSVTMAAKEIHDKSFRLHDKNSTSFDFDCYLYYEKTILALSLGRIRIT